VPDPDLIVLDEPTVAMDVESRRAEAARVAEQNGWL
jgi:ABC-type Mn2+/Zn2+ transport system ATPase subunit